MCKYFSYHSRQGGYVRDTVPDVPNLFPYQIKNISISFFDFSFIIFLLLHSWHHSMSRIGTSLPGFSYIINENPHILWVTSSQGASTRALSEMRPNVGGCTHVAVLHDIPVLVVCATSLHVLLSFCTVLYLLFIITHPAFCTHSLDCRRNLTMSGSQDNLSKPINITIADGIQII